MLGTSMSPQIRANSPSSIRAIACQGSKDGHQVGGRLFPYPQRRLVSSPWWTLLPILQHLFVNMGLSLLSAILGHQFDCATSEMVSTIRCDALNWQEWKKSRCEGLCDLLSQHPGLPAYEENNCCSMVKSVSTGRWMVCVARTLAVQLPSTRV